MTFNLYITCWKVNLYSFGWCKTTHRGIESESVHAPVRTKLLQPMNYAHPKSSPDTFRYKYQKYLGSPLIVPLWIGSMLLTWSSATSIYVNRLCGNLTFLLLLLKPAYNIGLIYTAPPPLTLIRIPSAQLFLMHLFNAECITKNHLIYYASQYTNLYGESNLFLSPST